MWITRKSLEVLILSNILAYLKNRMKMPLRDFRTVDCEALLRLVVRKRDLSTRTLAHIKHLLSGIFRYALRTGFLNGVNPVRDAVLPKAKSPSETYAYSLAEVLTMIELLPEPARTLVQPGDPPALPGRQ